MANDIMNTIITVDLSEKSVAKVAEKIVAMMVENQPREKVTPVVGEVEQTFRGARDAAAFLRISTGTFQALKNQGKIKPSYTVGSTHFYRGRDLQVQVSNLRNESSL